MHQLGDSRTRFFLLGKNYQEILIMKFSDPDVLNVVSVLFCGVYFLYSIYTVVTVCMIIRRRTQQHHSVGPSYDNYVTEPSSKSSVLSPKSLSNFAPSAASKSVSRMASKSQHIKKTREDSSTYDDPYILTRSTRSLVQSLASSWFTHLSLVFLVC